MTSPGISNEDGRGQQKPVHTPPPVNGGTHFGSLRALNSLQLPCVESEDLGVHGPMQEAFAIPEQQRHAFGALLESLAAFRGPRPLIVRSNTEAAELPALLKATRALAAESASSKEENRSNAVRFIDALRSFVQANPSAVTKLRCPLASCYAPLEKAIDSKVLHLIPNGGLDVDHTIIAVTPSSIAFAGFIVIGALSQQAAYSWTALELLGAIGLTINIAACLCRRSLASLVKGGFGELKYTDAILKLRGCMKAAER